MTKIIKLLLKPLWAIKRKISQIYIPKSYWKKRLQRFGTTSLKGVGNIVLSEEENEKKYEEAKHIFLELCDKFDIDFANTTVLEIGCGTGFYTDILKECGCLDYTGLDITSVLFPNLKRKYSNYKFLKKDITRYKPEEKKYDLIIMIDVTQHITDELKFKKAMTNIKAALADSGIFIVTSWLSEKGKKRTKYEVERTIKHFKNEFPNYNFTPKVKFRDKYIIAIYK